jgi:DNA-3-methyladenine glycosylase I
MKRCGWAGTDPLMVRYHDEEWGRPVHDDRVLFEFLILEGAQAGLTWSTILRKREGYRKAYRQFDARKIAEFGAKEIRRLMEDAGIVRNRLKILASIRNAKAFLEIQREFGSFDQYAWAFVNGQPIVSRARSYKELPSSTPESDALSKSLKKRGMSFVGSTIVYAFMQAVGMVEDHSMDCFRKTPT